MNKTKLTNRCKSILTVKNLLRLLAIVLFSFAFTSFASEGVITKPDFSRLRNERLQIIEELDSLKVELQRIDNSVRDLPDSSLLDNYLKRDQREVAYIRGQIEREQKNKNPNQAILDRFKDSLKFSESNLERSQADIDRKKNAEAESKQVQSKLKVKEKELFEVESKISDALGRDVVAQNFKSQISLYFALLLGFMILCFFGVAFYDEKVRNTIFSGQSGMQFVTLFSLIIAIILFGITGILEDKELAALLGGLSGYILGRYNENKKGTSGSS